MRRLWLLLALTLLGAAAVLGTATVHSGAATPSSGAVTITATPGTQTLTWQGTIPAANVHATSDCNDPGTGSPDQFNVTIATPPDGYTSVGATFTFSIAWTPSSPTGETTNDEILTVDSPAGDDAADTTGTEIGSSDGSSTTESVVAQDLAPGTYTVFACGYNNTTPQDYTGTIQVDVTAKTSSAPVASVDAQGLAFSSAVPADPQRDVAEPLITSDADGVMYDCGPTGFSNASDYAEVSTDGGDQFHLMGTPPRGQQGAGGGGDCVTASGITKNAQGHYEYAYAGLGALTGFTTSRSPDDGRTIANTPVNGNGLPGATSNGALADRQWMTFTDDHTVLLSYNQQEPRNVVVQTSTDGGLTYSATSSIAAPDADFPGPMHYIPSSHTVVMPWTKGQSVNLAVSRDGGATWFDCNVAKGSQYVGGGTAGFATDDVDSAGNVYVAWADKSGYHTWMSSVSASALATCNQAPYSDLTTPGGTSTKGDGSVAGTDDGIPTTTVGSTPSQVDRDEVRTTVFPWIAAGGAPGRAAVAFYGTDQDGDPNTSAFKAAWNVYVSQSLNALDGGSAQFGQVKATAHPFHYDSICLNGLACDTTNPGDRSLADFFAITYNQKTGKLSVVFDRGNKQPDDSAGYVATPMVATQIAGPSNGGGTVTTTGREQVRTSSPDPTGDALSTYSAMATGTEPPAPPSQNEPAADFTGVDVAPDAATSGFTVTMHVADLSTTALTQVLTDTGDSSVDYVWRFGNGWQDAGASASWSPAAGWTFGFDQYTTGSGQCGSDAGKCVIWPQATSIGGKVDATAGTITLTVPASVLRALGPNDAHGRPTQVAATTGSRFYDGTAFSFADPEAAPSPAMTWMEQLDNTPAMDFLLPAATTSSSGGGGSTGGSGGSSGGSSGGGGSSSGGGGGGSSSGGGGGGGGGGGSSSGGGGGSSSGGGGSSSGGGGGGGGGSAPPTTTTTPAPAPAPVSTGAVKSGKKTLVHLVVVRGIVKAAARTTTAHVWINRKSVVYIDRKAKLRFRSAKVTSVAVRGHSATLRGVGTRNRTHGVRFRVVLVAGKHPTVHVWSGKFVRSSRLVHGTAVVR